MQMQFIEVHSRTNGKPIYLNTQRIEWFYQMDERTVGIHVIGSDTVYTYFGTVEQLNLEVR